MKRFLGWMRQVLPRDTIVAVAVIADLAVEAIYLYARWWGPGDEEAFARVRLAIQVIAVMIYGGHRVATFHPACDADYFKWLERTPWTPRQPLPMGPIHLVPQDVVVILASVLLTRILDARVLYIPVMFLFAYGFSLAIVVWTTGQKLMAYTLGAALGFVIVAVQRPAAALIAACGATLLTPFAIRGSLAAFPWELPWFANGRSWQQMAEERKQNQWGWPFDVFAPKVPHAWIPALDGVGVSLLAGWWFLAVYYQLATELRGIAAMGFHLVCIAIIVRLTPYLAHHRPPISFLGRLATLRPWQTGFDHIFLAPLGVVALGSTTLVFTLCAALGWPIAVLGGLVLPRWAETPIAAIGVTCTLLMLLVAGPALEKWRLTGRHRIVYHLTGKTTGLGSAQKNQDFM